LATTIFGSSDASFAVTGYLQGKMSADRHETSVRG
jgi:hypothetical protein